MIDKVIRIFKIINAIQANPGISANDLAFKCEVDVRTIYRDLRLLPSVIDEDKLPPGFHTAYDKVMATHFKEKSHQKNIIDDIAGIIQMGTPAYRQESPNYLQPILQATLEHRTIDTVYHTEYRNETTERRIAPYDLVPRDQRFIS